MTALSPIQVVEKARNGKKITGKQIINYLFDDFTELHGDRLGSDDGAIIGGLATFHGRAVTVITTERGSTLPDKIAKHFGCPMPGGYRKAVRLAEQAGKFKRPILCFVNTAGAFPSKDAEEGGQGEAIAQSIFKIGQIPVPIITVIYGEGGSGGALALACGDEVWMLNYSTYSILSPEGFASILWKDASKADEAAKVMQMTPAALLKRQIIEGIIDENEEEYQVTCQNIDRVLWSRLSKLQKLTSEELIAKRQMRYRKF
ncbi:acetyl-CoA carboxylase carboxyl transferase subunit alpha [Lactobacillus sp. 0.1XD8-4]|uniref:acetyl-CoA carboxytransferase n=1 Tax=Limosilactobacillus walteri TaxID=2268022 RepID=A0ABR8P944_9LACO|nr:carboxyltransferase subunit alpha [Limosilactobacillus walteri]MBD5807251.1 acetyl-CoA carboxylase carboxyl transferase subunit alpha [Limosilactobacillus walteri]MRN06938.1 acetyl-CoA carboxylase carboxyl transferase subunit alpha [Lactobacillus sp. 0.1XD8-4]